jgi:hypothetical protein
MNLLLQLAVVAALIASMLTLRIFSGNRVTRQRLQCDPSSEGCGKSECLHGCGAQHIERQEE